MLRAIITSTNIAEAAWGDQTLWLKFNNGAVYNYADVPVSVYNALIDAESAGKFFHAEIKPKYAAVKVPVDALST